ncbi:hypothetical protein DMENIID0001_080020 [Sergentomyia squamirostris]
MCVSQGLECPVINTPMSVFVAIPAFKPQMGASVSVMELEGARSHANLKILSGELGNAVQDAFVIAVEQQARERLQRLSALKRITPVDMSQLSIKLNQQTKGVATAHDLSFLKEASPIYVTSFTGNHVTGTTTTTVTTVANCITGTNNILPNQQLNNNQPLSGGKVAGSGGISIETTAQINYHPLNHTSSQIGVPPSAASNVQQQQISASSTNNQQFINNNPNITLNNNNSNNCGAGNTSFSNFYGSSTSEILANGHGPKRELSTLSEGDSEPLNEFLEANSISKGELPYVGGTEVLLGDQSLRLDSR